ncbi:MAG: hypothetical protein FGM14_15920 [Flavobacteriales bacterium]|nr:hypothetical protein [Flavobacteriales bacterium]
MEDEKPQFNFKQHIPKRFGRSYVVRMVIYILGFSVALGFLIQKWNAADSNKKKIDVLDIKQNKEIDVKVAPE